MKIFRFRIRQYVEPGFCLNCPGCCRYGTNPSIWAPNLLKEEKLGMEKIGLIARGRYYICSFLNFKNNRCRIYNQRPLECRLYPFLLNHCGRKLYLSIDTNCPGASGKIDSKEFKSYLDYLLGYLYTPAVLIILKKNRNLFPSYSAEQIFNLAELKI
ncbi:MAG: YkgJ family cysteine cluster protein [Candidatus Omnitrophota bacterium]